MKPLFLFFLFAFASSCAPVRELNSTYSYPSPFTFKLIDSVAGSKDVLFVRSQEWLAKNFGNSNSAIKLTDKEVGKLVAKSILSHSMKVPGSFASCNSRIRFNLTVDIKDNKYRIELTDFIHEGCIVGAGNSGGNLSNANPQDIYMPRDTWLSIKKDAQSHAYSILKSFGNHMKSIDALIKDGF